ncbi:transposase [Rhodohalobacter barkolensis]|uniref:Transposase n=1 Tax=Rhodohalobacter barkolensis TaxID=2053187 RepID=A0A2N0VFP3_9BACT|nr:transposase [Rhodohalobacter barkolensis]PKD43017.1 transposase [Rhodohalobacter barkolensis]
MSQSLSKLYIHLTFSTKNRLPLIPKSTKTNLHSYLAGTFKKLESPALIINSVPDHIHALYRMSKNVSLANIVEQLKKSSSKWMKENTGNKSFYWQTGYGAFSVSSSKIETTTRYIARQEIHHQHLSYRDEIEKFIQKYDVVEYNPDYFWKE